MPSYLDYIKAFTDGLSDRYHRYASFDYCYSYFITHNGTASSLENLSTSCFILWSYLASWGMLRGSSLLLQKNPHYLESLIIAIDSHHELFDEQYDFNHWNRIEVREKILNCYNDIDKLLHEVNPTCTLITKIMLGVYGCVPALDTYFKMTFGIHTPNFNDKVMLNIFNFVDNNGVLINTMEWNYKPLVRHYNTNKLIKDLHYTTCKMVDMYGFVRGIVLSYQSKDSYNSMSESDILDKFKNGHLIKK